MEEREISPLKKGGYGERFSEDTRDCMALWAVISGVTLDVHVPKTITDYILRHPTNAQEIMRMSSSCHPWNSKKKTAETSIF